MFKFPFSSSGISGGKSISASEFTEIATEEETIPVEEVLYDIVFLKSKQMKYFLMTILNLKIKNLK